MFGSHYLSCAECGASVERLAVEEHHCDPERLLDFQMFGLREEIAAFETTFLAYLTSPHGQFQRWLAAREVLGSD